MATTSTEALNANDLRGRIMSRSSSVRRSVAQFELGRWLVTCGAREELVGQSIMTAFIRHAKGDFGDICNEDFDANLDAIAEGLRIVSIYQCDNTQGTTSEVYVITEADRSVTTLLLAEEY
jgi:hypothetical protein